MVQLTDRDINDAVTLLSRSDRGRAAMRDTLKMLDNGGASLDCTNQFAVLSLLVGAFTSHPGTAIDKMREALRS